jgi:hypothetical protein
MRAGPDCHGLARLVLCEDDSANATGQLHGFSIYGSHPVARRHNDKKNPRPNRYFQMNFDKTLLDKSAITQLEKAEECFDLARIQHEAADAQHEMAAEQLDNAQRQYANADQQKDTATKQHANAKLLAANADKLDELGHMLNDNALEIKGEAEMASGRNSPRFRPLDAG